MERVTDLQSLATRLGPVMYAPDRLVALERAGTVVDPAIPEEVRTALATDVLGLEGRRAVALAAGPSVPISLTLGPPAARLNGEASTINGFDLVATVFLSSIDDIVRKLWEGLTYPQDITPADAAKLLDVGVLDEHFAGVPDGAQLGPLLLPAPPRMHTIAGNTVAVTQPLRVQLVDPAGTIVELVAVATVQFPVVLLTTENEVGINWFGIPASTTVSLTVDPSSGLQPRDAASLERFSARIALGVGNAVAGLAKTLNLSPVFDVPGNFDRSKLRVDSAALWLSRWNQTDQLTFGVLIQPDADRGAPREEPAPDGLAPLANLFAPETISLVISESFVERGLRALVASGQLAERISEKIDWLRYFEQSNHVEVDDVDVTFGSDVIKVGLDCRLVDACPFAVDFDFRATVNLRPEVIGGQLRLTSDGIDLNLDNTDTIYCALTSILGGPAAVVLLTIGSIIAACITVSFNKKTPAFWQGTRLPGTEVFPRIDLTRVAATTGSMSAAGDWYLAPDEATTFVALQVLSMDETTGVVSIAEGVTVDLLELGAPAPAGDDYVPVEPNTGEYIEADGSVSVITTKDKLTFGDVLLATTTTERHGLARFAVVPDLAGGLMDVTTKRTSPGGQTFTTHGEAPALGDAPDLAVTITLADGFQPIVRQPIAVNLAEHHLGNVQEPVRVVYNDRCRAERQAVTAAQAAVDKIQADLQELRDELDRAPQSEKDAIRRGITRLEDLFLQPALVAREAALSAREVCQAQPH